MLRSAALMTLLSAGLILAQTPAVPKLLYGHDVKVRGVDEKNFSEKTGKIGFEVFHDAAGGVLLAVSEAGHLAITPFASGGSGKQAEWVTGIEMRMRDGGEVGFKDSKRMSAELYKDGPSGKVLIVTTQRTLAWVDAPANMKEGAFEHQYGITVNVRPPSETDNAKGKAIGLEAYKDSTTGRLVYASDSGFVTTTAFPATPPNPKAVKAPQNLYGLMLYSRKADETNFTKDTKYYGLEVVADPNSGQTLFLCESGSVAAIPELLTRPSTPVKPLWQKRSFALKARKAGDSSFDKAGKFGFEVFEDKNSGATIYISESGCIAVKK